MFFKYLYTYREIYKLGIIIYIIDKCRKITSKANVVEW